MVLAMAWLDKIKGYYLHEQHSISSDNISEDGSAQPANRNSPERQTYFREGLLCKTPTLAYFPKF